MKEGSLISKNNKIIILVISHMYPREKMSYYANFIHEQIKHLLAIDVELRVFSPQPYSPIILVFISKWKKYWHIPSFKMTNGVRVFYPRYIRLPGKWYHKISSFTIYHGIRKPIHPIMQSYKPHILHVHFATPARYIGVPAERKYNLLNFSEA